MKKLLLFLGISAISLFAETVGDMLNAPIREYTPTRNQIIVSKTAITMLTRHHYDARPVTPAVSSEWFREYFRLLDFRGNLFLQSDIEDFRSYEPVLLNQTSQTANLEFAFKVYVRYLHRLRERTLFFIQCLDSDFDFSVPETIVVDRKDAPRPATKEEQQDYWRKLVKNEVLAAILDIEQEKTKNPPTESKETKTLAERIDDMKKNHARYYKRRNEIEPGEILEYFLSALMGLYDPHSTYMAPDTKENFDIGMSLSLQGIGATLTTKDSYTTVVDIVQGGPADKDGRLKKGDRIIEVAQDGKEPVDVVEMSLNKVVAKIRGPKGTKVHLTILPEGSRTSEKITIVRDEVKLTDSEAKSEIKNIEIPGGGRANVLVLHLPSFYCDFKARYSGVKDYKSTTRDMIKLLKSAGETTPLSGVVLDLRGNGGGSLDEAINLAGLFFEKGPVVQIRNGSGTIEKKDDTDKSVHFQGPVIVMVDRLSASASEIVAAALQDHGRALVVGDAMTHGKGTVQNMFELDRMLRRPLPGINKEEFGSVKLTIAKFYRINGGSTQCEGVVPDIVFPSITDAMELGENKLPHALPWDDISPVNYTRFTETDAVKSRLLAASNERIAKDPAFTAYKKDIEVYGNFTKIKEIPLELNARKEYMKKQDAAEDILKKFRNRNSNYRKDPEDTKEPREDLVLRETMNIMADFIAEVNK